jgi:hypothetical protein
MFRTIQIRAAPNKLQISFCERYTVAAMHLLMTPELMKPFNDLKSHLDKAQPSYKR